jgi:putative acetyltransferase
VHIRPEQPADADAIRRVTAAAFADIAESDQTEPRIVDALRAAGALTVSLVAIEGGEIVGNVAFSPVAITTGEGDWYGLGPVSVRPDRQRRGIGQALVRAGLGDLRTMHAAGCVVLGDPAYYGRFGFAADPALAYHGAASPYLQRIVFHGPPPQGEVRYHAGFGDA